MIPIVGIHGWKGSRDSFKPITDLLSIDDAEWFFPQAPYKMGENQFTWAKEIEEGVYDTDESQEYIINFFNDEVFSRYNPEQVHVMGFSQGATTCFEFVLKMPFTLAGVFPIAGFLRDFHSTDPRLHPNQKETPIFIGHGRNDDVVPVRSSEKIYEILKKETDNVELYLYNGGHKIGMSYIKESRNRILSSSA